MKYPTKSQKRKIEKFVKSQLGDLNWVHTQNMRQIGQKITKAEKADLEIVDMAILFHDIAKDKKSLSNHASAGAKIASQKMQQLGLENNFAKTVTRAVLVHSYPFKNKRHLVKTIEEKVMFDTDMVQQLSPFGIAKHIILCQELPVKKMSEACLKFLDVYKLLFTKTAKKMAKDGDKYVKDFFNNLKKL